MNRKNRPAPDWTQQGLNDYYGYPAPAQAPAQVHPAISYEQMLAQLNNPISYQLPPHPGMVDMPPVSSGAIPPNVPQNASLPENMQGPTVERAAKTPKDKSGGMWDSMLMALMSGMQGFQKYRPEMPNAGAVSPGQAKVFQMPKMGSAPADFKSMLAQYLMR